jgi:hypothetical protein
MASFVSSIFKIYIHPDIVLIFHAIVGDMYPEKNSFLCTAPIIMDDNPGPSEWSDIDLTMLCKLLQHRN